MFKQTPYGVTKLLGEFIFDDRHKKNINWGYRIEKVPYKENV